MNRILILVFNSILLVSCINTGQGNKKDKKSTDMSTDSTKQYGYNRDFLKKHTDVIELKKDKSAIVLIPEWQGRVMTSTAEGNKGFSFGWINRELISSGKILPHINAFGGEERLWLGPEGGQFSIFFSKGSSFTYNDWQTPAFLDTTPFNIVNVTDSSALFAFDIETENYSGTPLKFRLEREVSLLPESKITGQIGIDVKGLNCVAYRSDNKIINKGEIEWRKETGLLSIWMLGMFNPSPAVVVVIPFKAGDNNIMGTPVNDNYFGKVPADRLKVADSHIFFRADGKSRGKIGIPPLRATGTMGSFDSANNILTLLICKMPEGKAEYVNSSWEIQKNPFSGDALNSYNDGPLEDGTQMGPFYELETSSPAATLKPGESLCHTQYTIHLTGDLKQLDRVSRKVLGVSLEEIKGAF
jgi:predicted small secreted protein